MDRRTFNRRLLFSGTTLTGGVAPAAGFQTGAGFQNVDELWSGFDPRALALDTDIVFESKENGLTIRKVHYTSEVSGDFPVRVVAFFGFPTGSTKLPGILHIHGGGQSATREYVEYWARRGYACISLNWGGLPIPADPAQGNTDWGPLRMSQLNQQRAISVEPDARSNSWFHWAIACRRALTFLEQQSQCDASRLGAYGISMGGRLTWLTAGMDGRVKAAVSIFGAVKLSDPVPGIAGSQQIRYSPEDAATYRATLDAISYAPRIQCPFFFLSASDDFYSEFDFVDEAIGSIPHERKWQSFTPHFNHHVEPAQSAALPMWMDRWLKHEGPPWPKSPAVSLEIQGGTAIASLLPDRASELKSAALYYSTDPYPRSRFWRTAPLNVRETQFRAQLPLSEIQQGLYVYASVMYASGLSLSSRLAKLSGNELSAAKLTDPPVTLIDDFRFGAQDWFVPAPAASINPQLGDKRWFETADSILKIHPDQGRLWRAYTRKLGDPKWRGPAGASLRIRVRAQQANMLLVSVTENEYRPPRTAKVYLASVSLKGSDWESVTIPLSAFRSTDDRSPLRSWHEVNLLGLQGQYMLREKPGSFKNVGEPWAGEPPQFARIEFQVEQAAFRSVRTSLPPA